MMTVIIGHAMAAIGSAMLSIVFFYSLATVDVSSTLAPLGWLFAIVLAVLAMILGGLALLHGINL